MLAIIILNDRICNVFFTTNKMYKYFSIYEFKYPK